MIAATVDSVACWLLTCEPNTGAAVRLEVAVPVETQRGLTGRTSWRPSVILPRCTQSWAAVLDATEFAAMRDASLTAQDEPLLAPVWRHAWRPATESATLTGGLIVAWTEGFASWAINPGSYAGYDYAAPLLYGRFTSPPKLTSVNGANVQVQLEVAEDGPAGYAIAPVAGILADDTVDGGFAVFPFAALADWSSAPSPGLGVVDVQRLATGPGRMQATIFYPQTPERVFRVNFSGVGRTEAAQLIAWWLRRAGQAGTHLVPLTDLGVQEGGTILAHHTNPSLVLDALGPITSCSLSWRESAPEVAVPDDETAGATLGPLSAEAWFFEIALDFNGAVQTWHLTNWESGAYVSMIDWQYNACDFDQLVQSIDMEDDECVCTFRYFAGGPWDNWLPGRLAARGKLTIYRALVSSAGVFTDMAAVWTGDLRQPDVDGPIVTWRGRANTLFALNGPKQLMTTVCGTMLFRTRCGLALSDWTWNAAIVGSSGNVVTVGSLARANSDSNPSGFGAADWFALGWLGWSVAGTPYRIGILGSAALASGQIALTLDRPPGLSVGASVLAVPGCDRLYGSGCLKFANQANHRGFDQMPAISPAFILPQPNVSPAKK